MPAGFSTTYDFKSARTPLLVMSKLPNFVLGRYGIVLDVRYLFLGATLSAILGAILSAIT